MSRSNPTTTTPHPCKRWLEFKGSEGKFSYYDKDKEVNVDVPLPITFILLDSMATVKGWHDPSNSGIVSNEVRDTRNEILSVRSFKGREIASGLYSAIKDKVKAAGGHFTANLYMAYKEDGKLNLGSIQFKGAALNAWVDWSKEQGQAIWDQAISIESTKEGKKGSITFQVPVFTLKAVSPETNEEAKALDRELQTYLDGYFKRTKQDAVASVVEDEEGDDLPF